MKRILTFVVLVFLIFSASIASASKELVLFWDFDIDDKYLEHMKSVFEEFEKENDVSIVLHLRRPFSTDELHDTYKKIRAEKKINSFLKSTRSPDRTKE